MLIEIPEYLADMLDECVVCDTFGEEFDYGRKYLTMVAFYDARRLSGLSVAAYPSKGERIIRRYQDELGDESERKVRDRILAGEQMVRRATRISHQK